MLPFYYLFLVFHITTIVVNSFNTCHLQPNCDHNSIHCNKPLKLCFCPTAYRLLQTGVCLQSSNVNPKCLQYQSCINANCIAPNGLEVNFNGRNIISDINVWHSLSESVNRAVNNSKQNKIKLLAFCHCDHRTDEDCNYRVIGRQCTHHHHCSYFVPNSECENSVCTCKQTHYHLDDSCLQKKNFDQICSESSECTSNLLCRSSQCKCRKNYEFNVETGVCLYKPANEANDISGPHLWDDIAKVGGFVIIVVVMLFLCTKKESELQNEALNGSTHRRRSTSVRTHRQRSSSVNSHRPLTQTSSNASRSSAYRTFEEPVPTRQTIIIPTPTQLVRSLSSSSDEIAYNPYQFDTLFPQQSDNDDPPSYEEVIKEMDKY